MPTKAHNLFDDIASFSALLTASQRAAKGKRSKPGVAAFLANLEKEVLRLERELSKGQYHPGRYTEIEIAVVRSQCAPLPQSVAGYARPLATGPYYTGGSDRTGVRVDRACRSCQYMAVAPCDLSRRVV